MIDVHVLTLFPDTFPGTLGVSLLGKAHGKAYQLHVHDLRQFADRVDDRPFGGGPGMIIKAQVIDDAIVMLGLQYTHKIVTCPQGIVFTQQIARSWTQYTHLLILCGRYDGIDCRVLEKWEFHPVSLGDFILCGGEVAALTMLEATIRLLPEVLGNPASLTGETHHVPGAKYHKQYTRPRIWQDRTVPQTLLDGNHKDITAFRKIDTTT